MVTLAILIGAFTVISPEWAAPANTALLILLTYLSKRNTQRLQKVHSDVSSAAAAGQAAAEAAAHAAQASSEAARIGKEIGGTFRTIRNPAADDEARFQGAEE